MYTYCNSNTSVVFSAIDSRSLICLNQWVRTEHNGKALTGRVLTVAAGEENGESGVLYEVELPAQSGLPAITRVVRSAGQLSVVTGDKLADLKPSYYHH